VRAFGAQATGTVGPGGASVELSSCSYAAVGELGDVPWPQGNVSVLEAILIGGAPFGVPLVPGMLPDVDVDRDGLEQFTLDEDGHLGTCIDGDGTLVEGRDCFRDPRMADGFSLNVRMVGLSARYAGRQPGWEQRVEGTCETRPEHSLFDPPG